jgi:phosphoserine aminotransferase
VYLLGLVLKWVKGQGGLAAIAENNRRKAQLIYDVIDGSGFYRGHARKEARSLMNLTFRLPDEKLEKKFNDEAEAAGMAGLQGHRSVGGLRASLYNACPMKSAQELARFMRDFEARNG